MKTLPMLAITVLLHANCAWSADVDVTATRAPRVPSQAAPSAQTKQTPSVKSENFQVRLGHVPDDDDSIHQHWALLVAGNYRHQADVCHAYQVLMRGGFMAEHVIVMMYDDIANNTANPYPGQIFNCPNCTDVYQGVPADYTGEDVNAWNFYSVLLGDWLGVGGVGTGRVIDSGGNDRVFVYYTDHGAPGILGMPQGPPVYADELMATIAMKHLEGGYREMVFFVEACESGSIFGGMLQDSLAIFATTAANAKESSWATYCSWPEQPGEPATRQHELHTCLGDLYSVAWIELAEKLVLDDTPLQLEFLRVQNRTSNNGTFIQGSHAQEFGSRTIANEAAGDFQGQGDELQGQLNAADAEFMQRQQYTRRASQHAADLVHLEHAAQYAPSSADRANAAEELQQEQRRRNAVDRRMQRAVDALTRQHPDMLGVRDPFSNEDITGRVDALLSEPLYTGADGALMQDWTCLRSYVKAYQQFCGTLDTYAARHTRAMANLCNAGVSERAWTAAIQQQCGVPH